MRRIGIAAGGLLATGLFAVSVPGGGLPPLPLQAPQAATSPLLGMVSDDRGARLAELDPATLAPRRSSSRIGWFDGWVRSPDGKLLAVADHSGGGAVSTLRFASVATLRWARRPVQLDGHFRAAIWPRPGTLYALVADCCDSGFTLETVDAVAEKVVARTPISSQVVSVARSGDGLVLLATANNAIAPARLLVVGPDGGIRSVVLDRILAGTRVDQTARDPIAATRQPGLAVDPDGGVAYVVDPDGLVAAVSLGDLTVAYHRLSNGSALARFLAWLVPAAEAKGLNGPSVSAQWLGNGLIAVAGSDWATSAGTGGNWSLSQTPEGLRIVDVGSSSSHPVDPAADAATVADGLLLATGVYWRSTGRTTTAAGEGLAAYGQDGSLRWRLEPGAPLSLVAVYRGRAIVQAANVGDAAVRPLQVVDLATGRVVSRRPGTSVPSPLLGAGS